MTALRASSKSITLRRLIACVSVVLVALVLCSAPASATIVERYSATRPYNEIRWDCGYAMTVVGSETHKVHVRADKRVDGNAYVSDKYEIKEVWTAQDGRSFTFTANALDKDVQASSVDGSLYEFAFQTSGQPATVIDSSGRVVYRDRGNLRFHYTIDLADDTFNFLGVKASGPHPIFDLSLCKAVAPLVGTDSGRYLTPRPLGTTSSAMGYYEYLPPSYSNSGPDSPLLVALNGYGENGDGTADGLRNLLATGIPRFLDVGGWPTDRPLVVLAPQHVEDPPGFDFEPCDGVRWGGSCNMQLQHDRDHQSPTFCTTPAEIHDFIAYAQTRYNVDPRRIYVTGLSCGAFGGWEYLATYGNDQVAAFIPVAGDGRPAWATAGCKLGSVPIWAFHGEQDDVVDPQGSIHPLTALRACPSVSPDRARLTIYPDLAHESWDQAYSGSRGDDIYTWMLAFRRS